MKEYPIELCMIFFGTFRLLPAIVAQGPSCDGHQKCCSLSWSRTCECHSPWGRIANQTCLTSLFIPCPSKNINKYIDSQAVLMPRLLHIVLKGMWRKLRTANLPAMHSFPTVVKISVDWQSGIANQSQSPFSIAFGTTTSLPQTFCEVSAGCGEADQERFRWWKDDVAHFFN